MKQIQGMIIAFLITIGLIYLREYQCDVKYDTKESDSCKITALPASHEVFKGE